MLYRFLECFFFYNKPIVEVFYQRIGEPKGSKIIYTSEFYTFKTMDDLFRSTGLLLPQKYMIKRGTHQYFPWNSVLILDTCELISNGKPFVQIKMKKIYGAKS
jgi:hypothetical protein